MWKYWKSQRLIYGQQWLRTAVAWSNFYNDRYRSRYISTPEWFGMSGAVSNAMDIITFEALED